MALKALLMRKHLNDLNAKMDAIRAKDAEFEAREADLEKAIEEVANDEQRAEVEEMVNAFEVEKANHESEKNALEDEINGLEKDLADEEAAQEVQPDKPVEERKETAHMETRKFFHLSAQERDAFFAREDVKNYLGEVRAAIREKRAISNVGLTIPTVMLGILKENVLEYSKLYKHVTVRPINGEGRQLIQGTIPEAIWTECCANLNELSMGFNDWEVDCYKVSGFFAICNANLEDSDVALATEILTALSQAIGLALDKAILYGRNASGTQNMPLGIMSRLAQTEAPSGYPATARPWVDLHSSNVKTIADTYTGANLFKQILIDAGAAKGKYARGGMVWVMNEKTYTALKAEAITFNAAGAIVSAVEGSMPVAGGIVEVLDFIPDNVIVAGYFDLYLLAERAGQKFASSEHVRFLADQTVFKGTARYDGAPIIAEAFVAIGINGTTPGKIMTFASDEANQVRFIDVNTDKASVVVGSTIKLYAVTSPGQGAITWSSATTAKATVDEDTGVVTGVASGSSVITAASNGLSKSVTVTVTTE